MVEEVANRKDLCLLLFSCSTFHKHSEKSDGLSGKWARVLVVYSLWRRRLRTGLFSSVPGTW